MRTAFVSLALLLGLGTLFTQLGADSKTAKIGEPAPAFTLQDQNGKSVSLSDYKGKIVVLEWFNQDCPYVQKHYKTGHMNTLASKYTDQGVAWLAINTTNSKNNSDNLKSAQEWKIDRPILNDSAGEVGKTYHATNTPEMYIINKDGVLVYKGAIDNKHSTEVADLDGATNYVGQALDEILAGKPITTPETKPYGCGVHYGK